MNLQDSTRADEADPPAHPTFLHHGLYLSQCLPKLPEARLGSTIDRDEIFHSDLALHDCGECATAVEAEVVTGCLGEVQLGIRFCPADFCRGGS